MHQAINGGCIMKISTAIFSLFSSAGLAEAAGTTGYNSWHWGRYMMYGYPGGMFMMFFMFLAVALVLYLVFRKQAEPRYQDPFRETPIEILKRRYAKGEITKEQFDEMKKELS